MRASRYGVMLLITAGLAASPGMGVDIAKLASEPAPAIRGIPREDLRSGYSFQSPDTQMLQDDDFANPGQLWVDRGAALFLDPTGQSNRSCAACHSADDSDLAGVAARYPAYSNDLDRVSVLEEQVQFCRTERQQAEMPAWESDELLSLTVYVASLSKGEPTKVSIDGPARPVFEAGQRYFYERRGQLNLACKHCHEDNWDRMLRGDRLSQGHGIGYPAYRIEWGGVGSLQRRLRFCNVGVRAEPFDFGSPNYVALELFLAWRAQGLPGETPAVRR